MLCINMLIKMKTQIYIKIRENKLNLIWNNNGGKPKILVSAIAGIVVPQAQRILYDLVKHKTP